LINVSRIFGRHRRSSSMYVLEDLRYATDKLIANAVFYIHYYGFRRRPIAKWRWYIASRCTESTPSSINYSRLNGGYRR